jgi:beta-glucosidase
MIAFPPGFRFGVATSAFQIEGADGRGRTIWDGFPGTEERAIDHLHRYEEDVALIAGLGVHDYRFSISWPRVLPEGTGTVSAKGLDFYDRLVDRVLAHGVRPVVTLYHWDLPQRLEDDGGWLNRDTAAALADYAAVVADRLADRVTHWITLNEMSVQVLYGYGLTAHAPARGLGLGALPAAHHQLLAHGLTVQLLRTYATSKVGVAAQHFPVAPATEADQEAAEAFAELTTWSFSDPILAGTGPFPDEDLRVISSPLDFYGVNFYEPVMVETPRPGKDYRGILEVDIPAGLPFAPVPYPCDTRTDFGWAVVPAALTDVLRGLKDRYPGMPPMVITENGASYADPRHDDRRIAYLDAHLRAVGDALDAGVDVRGYYVWSALDNVEWAAGRDQRFGLIHVDPVTLARTPKDSYHWYRDLVAAARLP